MKFGSKLETFLVPEWADKYIRYKYLNKLLKSAQRFKASEKEGDEDLELQSNIFVLDLDDSKIKSFEKLNKTKQKSSFENDLSIEIPELEDNMGIREDLKPTIYTMPKSNTFPNSNAERFKSSPNLEDPKTTQKSKNVIDVITIVAETFEEKGHLNFQQIPEVVELSHGLPNKSPSVINKLRSSMAKIEILDQETEKNDLDTNLNSKNVETENAVKELKVSAPMKSTGHTYGPLKRRKFRNKFVRKMSSKNLSMSRNLAGFKYDLSSKVNKIYFRNKKITTPDSQACFDKSLRDDIRTVIMHYNSEMEYITILIDYLRKDVVNRSGDLDKSHIKLLQKAVTALWDSSDKLKSYLNTNILAVYKLLKKKDKLLHTNDLVALYPSYKQTLLSIDSFNETNEAILSLYELISEPEAVDFNKMKMEVESTMDSNFIPAYYLSYMMGLCSVLFLMSVLLSFAHFGKGFNISLLLAHLPIFRVFFIFGVIWCGIGWCQNYLETYGVNYHLSFTNRFLFQLSNNYSVDEKDFYFFGALQSFVCLLLFVFFILDCKIDFFGNHNLHFIYPIILIICSFMLILLPKKNFKLKLRRKMLFAIFRSLTSPVCVGPPVSLADSILADVYTSLTRSFVDIVYIFSYFTYGLSNNTHHMHEGNLRVYKVISDVVNWVIPSVMIAPFFLRFSQCLRRYINENLWIHFGNMVKYISGIICVVVSSLKWPLSAGNDRLAVIITCYIMATIYNFLWDFFVDWGLSPPLNIFKRRGDRRMYRLKAYYIACLVNLLCRLTWALTVTPIKPIEHQELSHNIMVFIISLVEIFRRIVWVTFRLETEHLLNSYKYRTALWVPKLYKCKTAIVKELSVLNK
ncbi:G-protein associated signal transduction protein, putative [Theileria annulata]|uniref:G-protein associated signal transduction protein, putative n=1 Tax=Theileria annulata TaxID=5874 RepID=Q4UDN2_THEAN|nr:G-protein associated signal transduction protein, putative [Theileria annulata]CAI74807.1 G-protein associated signal transduction protein, putative [Theileria annulata]|eukprot:XP_952539.1 G-protein associated signal transduction protein, putative [Theileria annulata]